MSKNKKTSSTNGLSRFEKRIANNRVMAQFSRKKEDGTPLYNLYAVQG